MAYTAPTYRTAEDHDWRDCGCETCSEIRYEVYISRGE